MVHGSTVNRPTQEQFHAGLYFLEHWSVTELVCLLNIRTVTGLNNFEPILN